MPRWLDVWTWVGVALAVVGLSVSRGMAAPAPPNVILILADDLGFGDLGCYGRRDIRTPNLDRLARDGMRFTDFRVAQAVCSASRAAFLTGCLPNRIGIQGALGPNSPVGIHPNEVTLGELFQSRGYATAIVGKWHLGDAPAFNPLRHGFDEWFGLPYSNDMWPSHPTSTQYPALPLMDGREVVDADVSAADQVRLTERYTQRAVDFIRRQGSHRYFLYLPLAMPHVPLFASERHRGKSAAGLYGDVIEEIDEAVGRLVEAVTASGLERQTLVIFTSDNGPWLSYGNHAGVTGGFREGKGTAWEGGVRVPFIAWWPGQINPGSTYTGFVSAVDLVPTLAALVGAELPEGRVLDGRNLLDPILRGAPDPDETFYFPGYYGNDLCSIRSGPWKRVFPHAFQHLERAGAEGKPGSYVRQTNPPALYHLGEDPGESKDVSSEHQDVVNRLDEEAGRLRGFLGDSLRSITGIAVRPSGSASALKVRQGDDGAVYLRATNAIVHGTQLRSVADRKGERLDFWTRAGDWVEWEFELERPGRYRIDWIQACPDGREGTEIEARVNGESFIVPVVKTEFSEVFVTRPVGRVEFAVPGRYVLELRVRGDIHGMAGIIQAVVLTPVQ